MDTPHACTSYRVDRVYRQPNGIRRVKWCRDCNARVVTLEVDITGKEAKAPCHYAKPHSELTPFETIQQIRADHAEGVPFKELMRRYQIDSINTLRDWVYKRTRTKK